VAAGDAAAAAAAAAPAALSQRSRWGRRGAGAAAAAAADESRSLLAGDDAAASQQQQGQQPWTPPSLTWDMSLLATDGFLLVLQLLVLVLSLALPGDTPSYKPLYEAYQWQVCALALLCACWFAAFAQTIAAAGAKGPGAGAGAGAGADPSTAVAEPSPSRRSSSSSGAGGPSPAGKKRKRRLVVHVPKDVLHTTHWGQAAREMGSAAGWMGCVGRMCVLSRQQQRGARQQQQQRSGWGTTWARLRGPAATTAAACVLIAVLFAIRIPLFLWSSLAGTQLSGSASRGLYPHFFYTIPEVLPPLLILHVSMPGGLGGLRGWYERE
jgi:hypothetical protein